MKVKKSELMFYTAYTMYYIMNMLYTTRIGNFFGVISLNDLSLIVMPIVLGCLLITFLKSISKRYWFAFGTIFFAAVAIAYNSGVRAVLISIMFILCARMIDLELLCRFTFRMNTTMVLLVIALGQFTRDYTQTVKRAADNKRRYAPGEGCIPPVLLSGVSKGVPPLAHDFACKV